MKKNFLLLFLMALLPLAGWAQAAEFGDVSLGKYAYGDPAFPAPLVRDQKGSLLNATEHYTIVDGAFTDEDCTDLIDTEGEMKAMKTDGTKYYRKIEGKVGSAFEGQSKVAYFTVDKCEITLTFTASSLDRFYGQDPVAVTKSMVSLSPAFKFSQTWDGVVTGDAPTYTTVDINAGTAKAVTFVTSASTWKADNYTFKYPEDFTLEIARKSITPAVTLGEEVLTYNGENQAPTITIKDGETVLPNDQFDITFSKTEGGTYGEDHATAGTWYVKVSGKTTGNYNGTKSDLGPFTIAQKALNVYVDDLEKEYTGAEVNIDDAKVLYSGLVGTDASTKNPFGASAYTVGFAAAVPHINVGSYNLKPVAGSLSGNYENYNISLKESGKVTVTPKAITIKPANDLEKEFGENDAFVSTDIDASEAVAGDVTNIQGSYTIVRSDASDNTVGTHAGVLSLTKKAESALTDAQKTTLANYTITTGTNDFKITSAKLYVYPKSVTITYGDETPELVVATSEDVTLTKTPTVKFKDGAAPTNVGTYVLTLEGEAAAEGYEVELMDGQYTIETKALTPVIATQTIAKEATVEALDQSKVTFEGLVGEDLIGYSLKFGTSVTTDADKTWDAGIAIETKTVTGMKNANYTIDWNATGKLIVGAGTADAIEFTSVDADATTIANQYGETQNVTIKFAPRNGRDYGDGAADIEWKAAKWTTMVLPFDISVAELSQALGYAIVNVIDATRTVVDGTGSKFYGKLTMTGGNGSDEVLKANKPFLVKIAGNMDPAENYNFGSRLIVKADDTSVDAGGNCTFVGTYVNKTVTKDDEAAIWFMNGDEDGWQYIGSSSSATWTIRPFEAYIDMSNVPAASRNITFYAEEIDGTVTAIKGISVDENGRAKMNAEGWYNLNGMKLQGAPIQKGVYIYNGKKYVVK